MNDIIGKAFSFGMLIFVIVFINLALTLFILCNHTEVKKTSNNISKSAKIIVGDVFLGIGIGVFVGTIFAYSIRAEPIMSLIYGFVGFILVGVGAILRNLS